MPTYDYHCDGCGFEWELFQKITDDAVRKCPECNKKKARRLFGTGAAIVFKGSGFYQTDYRSESYKKGAKAAEASKSDSSKAGSSGDSTGSSSAGNSSPGKPATDSPTKPSKPEK